MKIAQIPSTIAPVRRGALPSVESLVWNLTRELTDLGHEVTTFGVRGSDPCGKFVETLPGSTGGPSGFFEWQNSEWVNLCRAIERSGEFDVIHAHSYLWSIPLQRLSRAPILHTLHITPGPDQRRMWALYPDSIVNAICDWQWQSSPDLHPAAVVHHGVDPGEFLFQPHPDSYVCYLGRFIASKLPEAAIHAAQTAGRRIVLAGPQNKYFDAHVAPLVDGDQVQYRGVVTGPDRAELLRNAACLVYPLRDPEPFGLVLIEAMMCGTPVAAVRMGAVPEIVDEGLTGFSDESIQCLSKSVSKACALDRSGVRRQAEKRFSSRRMAEDYVRLYERILRGEFR